MLASSISTSKPSTITGDMAPVGHWDLLSRITAFFGKLPLDRLLQLTTIQ